MTTRPTWERVLTQAVAERLAATKFEAGFETTAPPVEDYRRAALIVRALDRDLNLGRNLISQDLLEDEEDMDKLASFWAKNRTVLNTFWSKIGQDLPTPDVLRTRGALRQMSRASYRSLATSETFAAKTIADEVIAELTAAASLWMSDEEKSGLNGLSGLGQRQDYAALFGGFGYLRDELQTQSPVATRDQVLEAYDLLARSTSLLKSYVKLFQSWTKEQGLYSKNIDGAWGVGSEGAFTTLVPEASGRITYLDDLRAIMAASSGRMELPAMIGVAVKRDKWLETQGVDETSAPPSSTVGVSVDPTPGSVVTITPLPTPVTDQNLDIDTGRIVVTPKPPTGAGSGSSTASDEDLDDVTRGELPYVSIRPIERVEVTEVDEEAEAKARTTKYIKYGALAVGGIAVLAVLFSRQ